MDAATLLCSCADRTGIVATLTNFVAQYGGNIVDLDQHSDGETNHFFMRLVWDMKGFALSREDIPNAMAMVAKRFPDMQWSISFATPLPRVAVFVSKTQHCLADLLLREQMGELRGEITMVVGNHEDMADLAAHFAVPFHCVPVTGENRREAEARQRELLRGSGIDLVVLARYMQILGSEFVDEWAGRIINIHHSFLPAFVGARPYHQARAHGVKVIGATAHYVTAKLDQGPIITQGVTRVSHRDEVDDLIRKGRDIERQVLAQAVRLHLERRVIVDGNRTVVF